MEWIATIVLVSWAAIIAGSWILGLYNTYTKRMKHQYHIMPCPSCAQPMGLHPDRMEANCQSCGHTEHRETMVARPDEPQQLSESYMGPDGELHLESL